MKPALRVVASAATRKLNVKPASIIDLKKLIERTSRDVDLRAELEAHIAGLGGVDSPEMWDLYFGAYDRVVGFSKGYLDLIYRTGRVLPEKGTLLDVGAGSGNFSIGLYLQSNRRTMIALDLSLVGLRLTQKKFSDVDPSGASGHGIYRVDLRLLGNLRVPMIHAGVMNNVLYTLTGRDRTRVLKTLYKMLEPNATFVLNDPTPALQKSTASFDDFIWKVCSSAFESNSPATELDYALIAYINEKTLVGQSPKFLEPTELSRLTEECGFIVEEQSTAYYGYSSFLVLRKK